MITKFYYEHGLIIIPARVSGLIKSDFPVLFAFDTGSYYTNIQPEVLMKIGATATNKQALLLGVGEKVKTQFSILNSFTALGIASKDMEVTSHPLPDTYAIDGLLGNDFIVRYKICIDFPNSSISIL